MSEQSSEYSEVNVQDVFDALTADIAKLSREKAIEQAKNKNLINLVEQSRGIVLDLQGQVEEMKALVNAPKGRGKAPQDRKPRAEKPAEDDQVEAVVGELLED